MKPEPITETAPEPSKQPVCPNPTCGRPLDSESLFARRCQHCKGVLAGNQIKRKYPKPALDDPRVRQQLSERRDEIIADKGGADRLSAMQLGDIERYVVLEAFVTSWETYFMKSSPISRQGRVRSGYREGYLSSLDRLRQLGQQIGVERVVREVIESPQEWLERLEREDGHDDREPDVDRRGDSRRAAPSEQLGEPAADRSGMGGAPSQVPDPRPPAG